MPWDKNVNLKVSSQYHDEFILRLPETIFSVLQRVVR